MQLSGQRFGKLLVIEQAGHRGASLLWKCKCDCSQEAFATTNTLRMGKVRSCGCLHVEAHAARRSAPSVAGARVLFSSYQTSARRRKVSFDLSFQDFVRLVGEACRYCGAEPSRVSCGTRKTAANVAHSRFVHNGLDRVNNDAGYQLSNVVPCCRTCNTAKGQLSVEDFQAWIARVYETCNRRAKLLR